jgi:hypothetical protein
MVDAYECRYRYSFVAVVIAPVLLGFAGFVLFAVVYGVRRDAPTNAHEAVVETLGVALLVLCAAMFAWMGLGWLISAVTHRVALRLDDDAVMLGRAIFPPSRRVTVALRDVEAIVLLQRTSSPGGGYVDRVTYLGLRLRPRAQRPPSTAGSTCRAWTCTGER